MSGELSGWQRGEFPPKTSTTNVMSGVARDLVQAGNIDTVVLRGRDDGEFELTIPTLHTAESLLSFANTSVKYVGRTDELDELRGFLSSDSVFSWWVLTGPAGIGKSRLATELCRFASTSNWHAGFLREVSQAGLGSLSAQRPTLVVVDYAAQRSEWLSDALALLSQRDHEAKVRVLILERRASGEWWSATQRANRLEESYRVTSAMYAKPRPLLGLDRVDARTLVRDTAAQLEQGVLTTTQVEDVVDRAERWDPDLLPLFVQVATMDRLDDREGRSGRDDALRRIVARTTAQLDSRIGSASLAALAHNLRSFATSVGGLTVEDYAALPHPPDPLTGLLPGVFQRLGPSVTVNDLVDGVRPDIVGELLVLDRLDSEPTVALASKRLLWHAFRMRPDAYRGFVERAVADHTDHPRLLDLLTASSSEASPISDLELAVAVMQLLGRSDHPIIEWILRRINTAIENGVVEEACQIVITARFKYANLVRLENDMRRARNLYTTVLGHCDPASREYGSILNNRGITFLDLEQHAAAVADFSAVIDSPSASAEARACALNNRADILADQGDLDGSIADRSSVLGLAGTSYDRRYIALARRAQTLRSRGNNTGAHEDIARILETNDIAVEQKMQARLLRAEWASEDGQRAHAQADFDEIAASYRNFDSVEQRIHELGVMPRTRNL